MLEGSQPRIRFTGHRFGRWMVLVLMLGQLASTLVWGDEISSAHSTVLGPGDQIKIMVLHEEGLSMEVRLSDQGTISYPLIGQIDAAGRTAQELEAIIRNGLNGKYLVDPQVSVNIMEFRKFYVGGAVKQPGGFPYTPGMTVQQAIASAGGLTEKASEEVLVSQEHEGTNKPRPIRMQDPVRPGDHLEIKEAGEVVVEGEVKQPGVYPYTRGMTVHKAIALAGGRTERASKTITVIHENDPTHTPQEVEPFSPVTPGDLIQVEESFF